MKLNVTEATTVVLFSIFAVKERETATTTLTAKESSNVGETTATKILTVGSTRLMTAALIQCQNQMVAMGETIAALTTPNAVRMKVTKKVSVITLFYEFDGIISLNLPPSEPELYPR